MTPIGRRPSYLFLSLAAVTLGAFTVALGSQQPAFKSGAKTVAVYATVADKDGRLVPNLTKDDFEIKDDGKPQPIAVFSNEVQPITVVMMLDRSGSMKGNAGLVEKSARAFVDALEPSDRARIGTFADRIEIQPAGFTADHEELLGILHWDRPVAGSTPLWNAVDDAIDAVREQEGRRVVLVFSDGGDAPNFNFKNRSITDAMRRAQRENVMVYAIGLSTTVLLGRSRGGGGVGGMTGSMTQMRPDPGLATIAEDTGGGYFELMKGENLATTFAQVADELHHQYALGFEPAKLDDKLHKLDVKTKKGGMKVRARREYFAARQ